MKRVPCPSSSKGCKFLEIVKMQSGDVVPSISMISRAFPRIDIPAKFWTSKLKNDATVVMKENGDRIVGIANIGVNKPSASLDVLAVAPEYQGKGIGSTMLGEAENIARAAGKPALELMTERDKPENVSFYSKRGYKITGFDRHGYSHCPGITFLKDIRHHL